MVNTAATVVPTSVAVIGARGPLGRRVCRLVATDPDLQRLFRMDAVPSDDASELTPMLEGVDTLVLLGSSMGPELDGTGTSGVDVAATQALLDVAGSMGVRHLVVLSTAMVYGAWANNPVPLTEEASLRPVPSLRFAVQRAEIERLAHEWRTAHPGATVAVLRPCIAVSEETSEWLGRSLWQTGAVRPDDLGPPMQFVHLDDLAAAIDLARREGLDGPYNVAPDGWIPPERLRELAPPASRVRLPPAVAARIAQWRWRLGHTPTPPEVLPYTVHPWVVANDRLVAAGWEPASTNEEAFVAGVRAGPLADMTPRRRQELALGLSAAVLVAIVGGVAAVIVRARRRRQ
jgi:nucleoside-diphosphate-sugar epimerase